LHGGGSAVASAAALETINIIGDEGLTKNAAARGQQLVDALLDMQKKYPLIADVRGMGLMVGVEFHESAPAKAVQASCLKQNLLLLTCGTYENTIRWIPPLIVTEDQINKAVNIFEIAVQDAAQ